MRRDYVTLEVRHTDREGDQRPTIVLAFEGPRERLETRLFDADGDPLDREDVDVAFRFQSSPDEDATGVFSLAHRVTGEFLLEVNADAEAILDLVGTARKAGDREGDARYRVVVNADGDEVAVYEKRTLLVYDDGGSLLRQHSLIPSGVEL